MAQLVACLTGGQEAGSSSLPTPTKHKRPLLKQRWPFFILAMFYTYIIQSETTGRYYVGSTQDVDERLRRHNAGHSKSIRNKGPWTLVKTLEFETRGETMLMEKKIKGRGIWRFLDDSQISFSLNYNYVFFFKFTTGIFPF